MHLLLLACVGAVSLAFWPKSQDPAAIDWTAAVDKACTASRYGLRLAAAKQVANGGGAAVPALRAFAQQKGHNQIPGSLVDTIADADGVDAALVELLREWAGNVDFYYRASALRGIALRAPKLPERREELGKLLGSFHQDPAWLMRTTARFGNALLGDDAAIALAETDPRARVRLATLLLAHGKTPPLQTLIDALAEERSFLGNSWGKACADEAHIALKKWLGPAHPLANGGSFEGDVQKGIQALLGPCQQKSGQTLTMPVAVAARPVAIAGGIELLSCKHGDLHLQWTADGLVQAGIDAGREVTIPAAKWAPLWNDRTALQLRDSLGVVLCDNLRVCWLAPESNVKIAPLALPPAAVNWLKQLAAVIEEAGESRLAADLRSGLDQFAAR